MTGLMDADAVRPEECDKNGDLQLTLYTGRSLGGQLTCQVMY
jgi:hypothetical protein